MLATSPVVIISSHIFNTEAHAFYRSHEACYRLAAICFITRQLKAIEFDTKYFSTPICLHKTDRIVPVDRGAKHGQRRIFASWNVRG
jgi:hypothetical protein